MIIVCAHEKVKAGSGRAIAYVWSGNAEDKPMILRKQSKLQDITAFVVARNGQQYYLDGLHGTPIIMQADKAGENEREFYKHNVGLSRQLALDDDDNVYFSVAGENKVFPAHHQIYKVRPGTKDKAATAELFCEVPVKDMVEKNNWEGGFAFGPNDKGGFDTNTLYLSIWGQGPGDEKLGTKDKFGHSSGSIYRMTRKDGEWSKPVRVLASKEPIYGLVFTGPREALYAGTLNYSSDPKAKIDHRLYRFTDLKKTEPVLSLDNAGQIWSVSVVRGETTLPKVILLPSSKK